MADVRTRTGLLEEYLAQARSMEVLARRRLAASDPVDGRERQLVQHVLQHSIGLERALERWIALRCQYEAASS